MKSLEKTFRIREHILIPLEVTPLILLHPEAVEMEYLQRDLSVSHTINEAHNGILVIACGEGSRQPQTKCICRRKRWLTGQCGIVLQNFLQIVTADHEILKLFARLCKCYLGNSV